MRKGLEDSRFPSKFGLWDTRAPGLMLMSSILGSKDQQDQHVSGLADRV